MARTDADTMQHILLDGQNLVWRLVRSPAAKKLRIRVGLDGVRVVLPEGRNSREAFAFIAENRAWVAQQLARVRQLRALRRPTPRRQGRILFQGDLVAVRILNSRDWRAPNKVAFEKDAITIKRGPHSRTPTGKSLENWLRRQARERIEQHVMKVGKRLKRMPNRVYVMGQRTKWGNCSGLGNLSFNWRLVMAPEPVLRYIVTHEMVHLAVPDHSRKFWLTVQSLCADSDRARQWLVAHGHQLEINTREPLIGGKPLA